MPADAQAAIERFLQSSRQPALLEPGEPLLPLTSDNFSLTLRGSRLTLQAWDDSRNLVRRVTGVAHEARGRLELIVERFARKEGRLFLVDLARPASQEFERRSERLVFRERFRQFLTRQFADWTLAEVSADPNLESSLSPSYPRAFLRRGQSGWAAIAAPPESDTSGVLTFGLIWLDYLRHREKRLAIEGLAIYVPRGKERITSLRLLWLNPEIACYELLAYDEHDFAARLDPHDFGNIDTRVEICRQPAPLGALEGLLASPEIERVARHDGTVSLRVRGVEFARVSESGVHFGLAARRPGGASHVPKSSAWRAIWPNAALPPRTIASIHFIARTPKPGSNRRFARRSNRSMRRYCPRRSTTRCLPSPAATAASSTCWPSSAPAAWPSWN